MLQQLLNVSTPIVLSTGGGTPCYGNNMQTILDRQAIFPFILQLSIPSLVERIKTEKQTRPLVENIADEEDLPEFIGKHLFERRPFYSSPQKKLFSVTAKA